MHVKGGWVPTIDFDSSPANDAWYNYSVSKTDSEILQIISLGQHPNFFGVSLWNSDAVNLLGKLVT